MLIICATMLVLGIFIVLFQNVNANVKTVREEQGLQALIEDSATEEDIEYMRDELEQIPGVKSIEYLDKDKAFEDAKAIFEGQEYFLEGLSNVNIFPASFVIKFDRVEDSQQVKAEVEKIISEIGATSMKQLSKLLLPYLK